MLHLVKTGVGPMRPAQRLMALLSGLFPQRIELQRRRRFEAAVRRSIQRCAGEHWRYTESLFDEYFLRTHAAPLIQPIFEQQRWPTPQELALAWHAQFGDAPSTCTLPNLRGAVAVAAAFLAALRHEWPEHERAHTQSSPAGYGSPQMIEQR
jgi:hypothetical protein